MITIGEGLENRRRRASARADASVRQRNGGARFEHFPQVFAGEEIRDGEPCGAIAPGGLVDPGDGGLALDGALPQAHHRGVSRQAFALVGFVIAAVGFFLDLNVPLIVIGLVVAVGGALVGGLMARAGLGQVWE